MKGSGKSWKLSCGVYSAPQNKQVKGWKKLHCIHGQIQIVLKGHRIQIFHPQARVPLCYAIFIPAFPAFIFKGRSHASFTYII